MMRFTIAFAVGAVALLGSASHALGKKMSSERVRSQCQSVQKKAKRKKAPSIARAAGEALKKVDGYNRKCKRIVKKLDRAYRLTQPKALAKSLLTGRSPKKLRSKKDTLSAKLPATCESAYAYARKFKNAQALKRLDAQVQAILNIGGRCAALGKRLRR